MNRTAENLKAMRAEARHRLEALIAPDRLPGRKDENYRHTSLQGLELDRAPGAAPAARFSGAAGAAEPGESALIVASAGAPMAETRLADEPLAATGGFAGDLETFLRRAPERVLELARVAPCLQEDVFAALAEARAGGGIVVHVPRGARASGIVRGVHHFSEGSDAFFHRTLLIVEEGAELDYVDELAGPGRLNGKAPLASGLVQVIALDGARVRYSMVQGFGEGVAGFARASFRAGKDAAIRAIAVATGGARTQLRSESECLGRGARVELKAAARGDGGQLFDFWVAARHAVPDTSSETEFRAVMADQASAVFNGNIVITPEGLRTDATQRARHMLLSKDASIHAIPKLEIGTDDVKCAHGAAVSPVDLDQMFYLEARGIPFTEAERMIIDGFTEPVVRELPLEGLRRRVEDAFGRKHALDPALRKELEG